MVTDSTVQQRSSYRPYGEVLAKSTSFDESLGYAGEHLDNNGLIYLHARYLDPKLGRFISADPTVTDGLNRYTYTKNNPVSFVDRTGFGSVDWGTFFRGLPGSFANAAIGFASGIAGLASMDNAMSMQNIMQSSQAAAVYAVQNPECSTWEVMRDVAIPPIANALTLGLSGYGQNAINWAYDQSDANAAAWQQSGGGLAFNAMMMRLGSSAQASAPEGTVTLGNHRAIAVIQKVQEGGLGAVHCRRHFRRRRSQRGYAPADVLARHIAKRKLLPFNSRPMVRRGEGQ